MRTYLIPVINELSAFMNRASLNADGWLVELGAIPVPVVQDSSSTPSCPSSGCSSCLSYDDLIIKTSSETTTTTAAAETWLNLQSPLLVLCMYSLRRRRPASPPQLLLLVFPQSRWNRDTTLRQRQHFVTVTSGVDHAVSRVLFRSANAASAST